MCDVAGAPPGEILGLPAEEFYVFLRMVEERSRAEQAEASAVDTSM